MVLSVPPCAYHSSYAPMHLFCVPYCEKSSNGKVYARMVGLDIPVPKGATTPKWVEVGSRLDTMNDMTWEFTAHKYNPPPCSSITDAADCTSHASPPGALSPIDCTWKPCVHNGTRCPNSGTCGSTPAPKTPPAPKPPPGPKPPPIPKPTPTPYV